MTDGKGLKKTRKEKRKNAEKEILNFIEAAGQVRSKDIVEHLGEDGLDLVSDRVCYDILDGLVVSGKIKKEEYNRASVWYSTIDWEHQEEEFRQRLDEAKAYLSDLMDNFELYQDVMPFELKTKFLYAIYSTILSTWSGVRFMTEQEGQKSSDTLLAGYEEEIPELHTRFFKILDNQKKEKESLTRGLTDYFRTTHNQIYMYYQNEVVPDLAFELWKNGKISPEEYERFKKAKHHNPQHTLEQLDSMIELSTETDHDLYKKKGD